MRRFNLIPNAITAFGFCCGLFVIYKVFLSDGEENLFSFIQSTALLLFIAGLADFADGAAARLFKSESEFGGQFDSLSDAVTFGVAPPLLVLRSLPTLGITQALQVVLTIAAMIYTLCGVLRLVRYNLTLKVKEPQVMDVGSRKAFSRSVRQKSDGPDDDSIETMSKRVKRRLLRRNREHKRSCFCGLPIPAGAALIVSSALVMISPLFERYLPLTIQSRAIVMVAIMILSGYFMVSRWPFPKLKMVYFRVPSFYLIFAVGVFAVLLLYGLLDHFAIAFFILTWGYFLTSLASALFDKRKEKPSETD